MPNVFYTLKYQIMEKRIRRPIAKLRHCRSVWIATVLAAFALFAACERPEPNPLAPSIADIGTMPANKFIGTWVLCAMNDVNSEPPATCDLANATSDTLVFVNDSTLILHRGLVTYDYLYEFSDHFLFSYNLDSNKRPDHESYNRYHFRNDDRELVLCGHFDRWYSLRNVCFVRIDTN